jgi:hypothetical protein
LRERYHHGAFSRKRGHSHRDFVSAPSVQSKPDPSPEGTRQDPVANHNPAAAGFFFSKYARRWRNAST